MICGTKKKTSVLEKWPWMPTTANVCRQAHRQTAGQAGRQAGVRQVNRQVIYIVVHHSHSDHAAAAAAAVQGLR